MKQWYACGWGAAMVLVCSMISAQDNDISDAPISKKYEPALRCSSLRSYYQRRRDNEYNYVTEFLRSLVCDAVYLHKNLISFDTLKVAAVIVPTFLATRHIDERLQHCFHRRQQHKNINQAPRWASEIARVGAGPVIGILGTQALLSRDDRMRYTSQIMLIGVPILVYVNQLIKRCKFHASLRPWHENFSREHRAYGGFPSGHVSQATYLAVLYGMQFGYKFALPLGLLATFIGATFLTANRHYLSQLVAGVGFGAAYGLAASNVVSTKLARHGWSASLACNEYGGPAVQFQYTF